MRVYLYTYILLMNISISISEVSEYVVICVI